MIALGALAALLWVLGGIQAYGAINDLGIGPFPDHEFGADAVEAEARLKAELSPAALGHIRFLMKWFQIVFWPLATLMGFSAHVFNQNRIAKDKKPQ